MDTNGEYGIGTAFKHLFLFNIRIFVGCRCERRRRRRLCWELEQRAAHLVHACHTEFTCHSSQFPASSSSSSSYSADAAVSRRTGHCGEAIRPISNWRLTELCIYENLRIRRRPRRPASSSSQSCSQSTRDFQKQRFRKYFGK